MNDPSANELTGLMLQARNGCNESLGELLELYRNYLGLVANLHLDDRMQVKTSSSDIVQIAFVQAKRCFSQFSGQSEGELVAWLRQILVSQLVMRARALNTQRRNIALEQTVHRNMEQSSVMLAGLFVDPGKSPSQSAIRRERAVMLADALEKLPEDHREVIVLRNLHGKSFLEVAQQMNRSVDSVKGIWRRALGKLRELIGDEAL